MYSIFVKGETWNNAVAYHLKQATFIPNIEGIIDFLNKNEELPKSEKPLKSLESLGLKEKKFSKEEKDNFLLKKKSKCANGFIITDEEILEEVEKECKDNITSVLVDTVCIDPEERNIELSLLFINKEIKDESSKNYISLNMQEGFDFLSNLKPILEAITKDYKF